MRTGLTPAASSEGPLDPLQKRKIQKAAQEFEAVFVRQLVSSMRKAGEALASDSMGEAEKMSMDMAWDGLADSVAEAGGFGIAKMMEPWLAGDRAALDRIRSLPPAPPASWEASTAGIAQAAARSYSRGAGRLDEFKLAALAEKASAATGVDSSLIRGVIQTESAGDPQARSPKGALGLMQLMPGTARELGVDPSDPEQNVLGGARYLAALLKRFHGDERLALAGYNAGPGAVEKYDGIPPYAETRKYVDTVQAHRRRFAGGTP